MKNTIITFSLGFLTSTFMFLVILSMIEIPEYIITQEIKCTRGPMI